MVQVVEATVDLTVTLVGARGDHSQVWDVHPVRERFSDVRLECGCRSGSWGGGC
jgi:hypothetical protein